MELGEICDISYAYVAWQTAIPPIVSVYILLALIIFF